MPAASAHREQYESPSFVAQLVRAMSRRTPSFATAPRDRPGMVGALMTALTRSGSAFRPARRLPLVWLWGRHPRELLARFDAIDAIWDELRRSSDGIEPHRFWLRVALAFDLGRHCVIVGFVFLRLLLPQLTACIGALIGFVGVIRGWDPITLLTVLTACLGVAIIAMANQATARRRHVREGTEYRQLGD